MQWLQVLAAMRHTFPSTDCELFSRYFTTSTRQETDKRHERVVQKELVLIYCFKRDTVLPVTEDVVAGRVGMGLEQEAGWPHCTHTKEAESEQEVRAGTKPQGSLPATHFPQGGSHSKGSTAFLNHYQLGTHQVCSHVAYRGHFTSKPH